MRKILILLLVVGLLIGTFAVLEEMYHDYSLQECMKFSGSEGLEDGAGNPIPCGGEGDGGPPTPG